MEGGFHMLKKLVCLLIAMMLVCSTVSGAFVPAKEADGGYYKIDAQSKEWAKFTSHEEKVKALQPTKDLSGLSTKELACAALEYPLLVDIYAYDDLKAGVEAAKAVCPALALLMEREDAAEVLREFAFNSEELYAQLSTNDIHERFAAFAVRDLAEQVTGENFDPFDPQDGDDSVLAFDARPTVPGAYVGWNADGPYWGLRTPNGTDVTDYCNSDFYETVEDERIEAMTAEWAQAYPNAVVVAPASRTYNCHSFAWAAEGRIGYNPFVLEGRAIDYYLGDRSYNRVGRIQNPERSALYGELLPGDVVVFTYQGEQDRAHSALVYEVPSADGNGTAHGASMHYADPVRYISKWGCGPVVIHTLNDCPYGIHQYTTAIVDGEEVRTPQPGDRTLYAYRKAV